MYPAEKTCGTGEIFNLGEQIQIIPLLHMKLFYYKRLLGTFEQIQLNKNVVET